MCFSYYKTFREIEYSIMVYSKRTRSSGFVSLKAFKMYYVIRTFADKSQKIYKKCKTPLTKFHLVQIRALRSTKANNIN